MIPSLQYFQRPKKFYKFAGRIGIIEFNCIIIELSSNMTRKSDKKLLNRGLISIALIQNSFIKTDLQNAHKWCKSGVPAVCGQHPDQSQNNFSQICGLP